MASAGTLHDAFIDELRDAYHAERQITKALPKMIKAASSDELREAFAKHLEETKGQISRLEEVFQSLDEEKAADEKLTELADGGINQEAAAGAHGEQDEEDDEEEEAAPAPARGAGRGAAATASRGKVKTASRR